MGFLEDKNGDLSFKKVFLLASGVLTFAIFVLCAGSIVETNTAGQFQIKQAAITGNMSVRFDPGMYLQNFGSVYAYKNVATVGFGKENDGDGSADIDAIPVIFNDGSKANISGLIRVKLPSTLEGALSLKKEYAGGFDHFIKSGIVPIVRNAVRLSANLRSAQDAYTTLAIFQQAVEDQLKNGPYVTKSDTIKISRSTGDVEEQKVTVIVKDKDGNPLRLNNRFQELGCEILEAVIDVPDFDKKVEEMISKRKDEAMLTELSKQSALRAKQDAITTAEQGKADVAKAEASALVVKKQAVVQAQQEKEVAELEAMKKFKVAEFAAKEALEEAKKIKAEGMAKAAANQALVKAGLTPIEKAKIDMETRIGVAKALASVQLPKSMIIGGGGQMDGGSSAMQAIGYEAMQKLVNNMSNTDTDTDTKTETK